MNYPFDEFKLNLSKARSILKDSQFELEFNRTYRSDFSTNKNEQKQEGKKNLLLQKKILECRNNNPEFEMLLAKMVCGDNEFFPYRSSSKITDFFKNSGFPYVHNGETRRYWIKDRLKEMNVKEIHSVIKYLFNPVHFMNNDFDIHKARDHFKEFIKLSSEMDVNMTDLLELEPLLLYNMLDSNDKNLDQLIKEAIQHFKKGDISSKKIALKEIWDAFERVKTYFFDDKKKSTEMLINKISNNDELLTSFFTNKFNYLTKIGNGYTIRHSETDRKNLTEEEIDYFFVVMIALVQLSISKIKK